MGNRLLLKQAAENCAKEFTVIGADREGNVIEEKIWVRTQTETEIRAMDSAMTETKLRIRHKYDEGTDAYEGLKIDLDRDTDLGLATTIMLDELKQMREKAERDKSLPILAAFRGDLYHTDSDREKAFEAYQKRAEEHAEKVAAKLAEIREAREAELLTKPHNELVELAMRPTIRFITAIETSYATQAYRIVDCVRDGEDHSIPYFDSVDEVPPADSPLRNQLLSLMEEVDAVSPVDIKNSQGRFVVQSGPAESTPEPTQESSTSASPGSDSPKRNTRGGRRRSSTA